MRIPLLLDGIAEPVKLNPRIVKIPELTLKSCASAKPPLGDTLEIPEISNWKPATETELIIQISKLLLLTLIMEIQTSKSHDTSRHSSTELVLPPHTPHASSTDEPPHTPEQSTVSVHEGSVGLLHEKIRKKLNSSNFKGMGYLPLSSKKDEK